MVNGIAAYAIHPDGTGLRTMIEKGPQGNPNQPNPGDIDLQNPSVSPDGSALAYWNWETNEGVTDGFTHLLDLATGNDRLLKLAPKDPSGSSGSPHFSPDGKTLLVVAQTPNQLFLAPSDGSQLGTPIGPSFDNQAPHDFDFSPDGSKVMLTLGSATWIVDAKSGLAEQTKQTISTLPNWQRLAP